MRAIETKPRWVDESTPVAIEESSNEFHHQVLRKIEAPPWYALVMGAGARLPNPRKEEVRNSARECDLGAIFFD
jgi:hypothetical protein